MSRSRIWIFLFLLLTGLDFESSGDEKHSLIYISTAFSKNPDLPGFHQFTVVGLLDGKIVSFFDSDTLKMEPRQDWMKNRLSAEYWDEKTKSCISKEQQFKDIIQTLKDRLRQNDTDMHVLQRIHGCEATVLTDGTQKFSHIIDRYGYDGQDLLFFNKTNSRWVADLVAAKEIERKWNEEPGMKDDMEIYQHNDCMSEMSMFLDYKKEQLKNATPPEVFLSSNKTKDPSTVLQTCFTTDFYPKDIDLNIKRDGRVLTLEDGVKSSGIRPNEDDTHQRRDMVKILRAYTAKYSCEVIHRASNVSVEEQWDGVLPEEPNRGLIIGGVVGGLVLLVLVVGLVALAWFKRRGPFKTPLTPRQGSVPSIDSSVSYRSGSSGGNSTDGSEQPLTPVSRSDPSVDSRVRNITDGSGLPLLSVSHVSVDIPNPSDRPDEE